MILDVPFVYTAMAVLGRKRNPEKLTLRGRVSCAVREVSAADAPVVMWWQGKGGDPQDCVRFLDGRLYAPMTQNDRGRHVALTHELEAPRDASVARRWGAPDPDEDPEDPEERRSLDADEEGDFPTLPYDCRQLVTAESFCAALSAGAARISGRSATTDRVDEPTHEITDDGRVRTLGSRAEPEPLRQIKSSSMEILQAQYTAGTAALLSVDGVLFAEVSRPVYVLRLFRTGQPEMHRSFLADDRESVHEHPFLAESYAQMLDLHRELWVKGPYGKGREEPYPEEGYLWGRIPPPDVERPDLLADVDQTDLQVRRVGKALVSHLAREDNDNYSRGPVFSKYPRDVILAYGGLRDAVDAKAPLGDIVDAMARLGEAARPHGTLCSVQECAEVACARAEASFADDLALGAI